MKTININIKRNDDGDLTIYANISPILITDLKDEKTKEAFAEEVIKSFKEELDKRLEVM